MRKKLLSIILSLMVLLTSVVMPLTASANETSTPVTISDAPIQTCKPNDCTVDVINGKDYLYTTSMSTPAVFSVYNIDDKQLVASHELTGTTTACYKHIVDSNHNVYLISGITLFRYDPFNDTMTNLGKASTTQGAISYTMDIDENDNIYIGTYPDAKIIKYDPVSNTYSDLGVVQSGATYIRSLAYHNGYLYAGTSVNGQAGQVGFYKISVANPSVKTSYPLPVVDPNYFDSSKIMWLKAMTVAGDYILIYGEESNQTSMIVFDTINNIFLTDIGFIDNFKGLYSSPVLDNDNKSYFTAGGVVKYFDTTTGTVVNCGWAAANKAYMGGGWVTLENNPDFPNKTLVTIDWTGSTRGSLVFWNMETKKNMIWTDCGLPGEKIAIESIENGPNGELYTCGNIGLYGARYNSVTQGMNTYAMGQAEGMVEYNGKQYFGTSAGAYLYEFDPLLPVSSTNPKSLGTVGQEQDRPFAMCAADNKIFMGTIPIDGKIGGALAIYDLGMQQMTAIRNIVQDQSIMSITYKDGLIYGTTTKYGGLGATPVDQAAKIFVYNVATGQKVKEFIPNIGEGLSPTHLGGIAFDKNGKLWVATGATIFSVDPETELVSDVLNFGVFDYTQSEWRQRYIRFDNLGLMYVNLNGMKVINPENMHYIDLTVVGNKTIYSIGSDNNLYYADTSKLIMLSPDPILSEYFNDLMPEALPAEKAAAAAKIETDYTIDSWGVLSTALAMPETTNAEMLAKTRAINNAISGLVFAGKADLDTAKAAAAAKTKSDYTLASWGVLTTALAMPETTNAEVLAKTTAINNAITGLVSGSLTPVNISDGPIQNCQPSNCTVDVINGKDYLYTTSAGTPAVFSVYNIDDKQLVASFELPGTTGTNTCYKHLVDSNHNVYLISNITLFKYDPFQNTITNLGPATTTPSAFSFTMDIDENDNIYIGTYPDGKIIKYDPVQNAFSDLGVVDSNYQYVRSLVYHNGYLYAGTGPSGLFYKISVADPSVKASYPLPVLDPTYFDSTKINWFYAMSVAGDYVVIQAYENNGARTPMIVFDTINNQFLTDIGFTGTFKGLYTSPVLDNKAYFTSNGEVMYFDLTTAKVVDCGWKGPATFPTKGFVGGGWVTIEDNPDFPNKTLATIDWTGNTMGSLVLWNMETQKYTVRTDCGLPGGKIAIQSLENGPDGELYACGYMGHYGARYNPMTKEMNTYAMTQAEGMVEYNGKQYFGTYVGAYLYEFDPLLPVSDTNPKSLGTVADSQDRPFAMCAAGDKIFMGTIPIAGVLGGDLAIYDLNTKEMKTSHNIVQDQSVMSIVYKDGFIYGTTTVHGGLGSTPVDQPAKIFIYDVANDVKVKEFVPNIRENFGPYNLGGIAFDKNGKLWVATGYTIFSVDPETEAVSDVMSFGDYPYSLSEHQWRPTYIRFDNGGLMYVNLNGMKVINPENMQCVDLTAVGNKPLYTIGSDNNLYYADGSKLMMLPLTLPQNTSPTVADGTITYSNLTQTGEVTLNWNKATDDVSDQSALQYLVYRSDSNNIDTVADIEANGTAVGDYTCDIDTNTVTGLTTGNTYYFNIIVKDEGGNKSCYNTLEVGLWYNYVTNPDFETGDMTGWEADSGWNIDEDGGIGNTPCARVTGLDKWASQVITGLTPNTTYTLKAWVKTDSDNDTAWLGVIEFDGKGTDLDAVATGTTYSQISVTFTTGFNNTSARIYLYRGTAGTGSTYGDNFEVTYAGPGTYNPVVNPDFETGDKTGWIADYGWSIDEDGGIGNTPCARVTGHDKWASQVITGLTPNTTYTLKAWVKTDSDSDNAWLGVKEFDGKGTDLDAVATGTTYSQKSVTFTTGFSNTSARIYLYRGTAGTGSANGDNFEVAYVGPGTYNPVVNPDFETGDKTGWIADWGWNIDEDGGIGNTPCARVTGHDKWASQVITGLTPNTTYTLKAWVKTDSDSDTAWLGVKEFDGNGTDLDAVATGTAYSQKSVTFTTGSSNTSARIYLYRGTAGTGSAYGDNFEVN